MPKIIPTIANIRGLVITFSDGEILDVHDLVTVDAEQMTSNFSKQASNLAFLGARLAEAEWAEAKGKAWMEQEYARLDEEWRQGYELDGYKYTEPVIRAKVQGDEEYKDAQNLYFELEYHVGLLKRLIDATRQRGDMLISLGAHLRMEYDATGMHIDSDGLVRQAKQAIKIAKH